MSEQVKRFAISVWFYRLFAWKIISTATQLYIAALLATNAGSEQPFYSLQTMAHMGALLGALRGIDALLDPALQKLNPFRSEEPAATAAQPESKP